MSNSGQWLRPKIRFATVQLLSHTTRTCHTSHFFLPSALDGIDDTPQAILPANKNRKCSAKSSCFKLTRAVDSSWVVCTLPARAYVRNELPPSMLADQFHQRPLPFLTSAPPLRGSRPRLMKSSSTSSNWLARVSLPLRSVLSSVTRMVSPKCASSLVTRFSVSSSLKVRASSASHCTKHSCTEPLSALLSRTFAAASYFCTCLFVWG